MKGGKVYRTPEAGAFTICSCSVGLVVRNGRRAKTERGVRIVVAAGKFDVAAQSASGLWSEGGVGYRGSVLAVPSVTIVVTAFEF